MAKEIPILFSTLMVQAILAGRKTQTRRIVKPQPIFKEPFWVLGGAAWSGNSVTPVTGHSLASRSRYGKPGDVLYVRETHYRFGHWEVLPGKFKKNGKPKYRFVEDILEVLFTAPNSFRKGMHNADPGCRTWYKRNSLFMPKEAARIWLEVESLRVERLQEISEKDAKAEGANPALKVSDFELLKGLNWVIKRPFHEHQFGFLALWCGINGTKSWEQNPWVWVVTFKVLSTTGKPAALTSKPQTK